MSEAGSSPISTTASPGGRSPRLAPLATAWATWSISRSAIDRPSRTDAWVSSAMVAIVPVRPRTVRYVRPASSAGGCQPFARFASAGPGAFDATARKPVPGDGKPPGIVRDHSPLERVTSLRVAPSMRRAVDCCGQRLADQFAEGIGQLAGLLFGRRLELRLRPIGRGMQQPVVALAARLGRVARNPRKCA